METKNRLVYGAYEYLQNHVNELSKMISEKLTKISEMQSELNDTSGISLLNQI